MGKQYNPKKGDTLLFTSHTPETPNLVINVVSDTGDKFIDINGKEYLKRDIKSIYNKMFVMRQKQ